MSKRTDLTQFLNIVHEVALLDGTVVHLRKPTQGMLYNLQAMAQGEFTPTEIMNQTLFTILNFNTDNREFTLKWIIDTLDGNMINALITDWYAFVGEIQSNPNSESLPTQPTVRKGTTKTQK